MNGDGIGMKKRVGIYKIKEVMEGIYLIRNLYVNMILVVGNERALLFDTGYGFDDITSAIREITDKPFDVVMSHGHLDHGGGNWQFEEVYAHPADWTVMERHATKPYRAIGVVSAKSIEKIPFLKTLPKDFSEEKFYTKPAGNFKSVKEGDVFGLGGVSLQVIELPGHTPGSIGLYCPEKRLVLVSDAVNGFLYLFLEESTDLATYLESLYKLKRIDFDYMLSGHSAKIDKKSELDNYIQVAEHPDWQNGKLRKNDMLSGNKVVKVVRSSVNPKNKAKIVIEEGRLGEK